MRYWRHHHPMSILWIMIHYVPKNKVHKTSIINHLGINSFKQDKSKSDNFYTVKIRLTACMYKGKGGHRFLGEGAWNNPKFFKPIPNLFINLNFHTKFVSDFILYTCKNQLLNLCSRVVNSHRIFCTKKRVWNVRITAFMFTIKYYAVEKRKH